MQVNNTKDFQNYVFQKLTFNPFHMEHYTLYTNPDHPEYGYCYQYAREGYYELGIAEYTIPEDFFVSFHNQNPQLRFGTLFRGKTHFKLLHEEPSSFSPSSFLVYEENIQGKQAWRAGDSFHGIEITVFPAYIREILSPFYKECTDFSNFIPNHTYKFLPEDMIEILGRMLSLHEKKQLSPLYLESLLLESFAVLEQNFNKEKNSLPTTLNVPVGKERFLALDEREQTVLASIHEYLTDHYVTPPTIHELSSQFLLSPQKLTYGFSYLYHMTVYEYILSLRMARGSELLTNSSMRVEEISQTVGYRHPTNFIQAFKKTYGMTPRQFRQQNHSS